MTAKHTMTLNDTVKTIFRCFTNPSYCDGLQDFLQFWLKDDWFFCEMTCEIEGLVDEILDDYYRDTDEEECEWLSRRIRQIITSYCCPVKVK